MYAAILNQKLLTSEEKKQIKKKKKRSKLSEDVSQNILLSEQILFSSNKFQNFKTTFLNFQNGMGMIEGPGNNTGEGAVLMSYHNGNSSVSLQKQKRVLFFINQCKLPGERAL